MTRTKFPTRRRLAACLVATALTAISFAMGGAEAQAQDFPEKTITLVVPFGAGGNGDIISRMVADGMSERLGQSVVVENVPGAGGLIGAAKVKQMPADGYTVMLSNNSMTVSAALNKNSPVEMNTDFDHLGQLTSSYSILVAPPNSLYSSLKEITDFARENPGKFAYASSGVGSGSHLMTALVESLANVQMVHVPYDGGPQATTDVMAGRAGMLWLNLSTAMPLIESGELKALAIAAPTKLEITGDVPPAVESVPGFEAANWLSLSAPAGLPADVKTKLAETIRAVVEDPKVSDKLEELSQIPTPAKPEEVTAKVEALTQTWKDISAKTGLALQ